MKKLDICFFDNDVGNFDEFNPRFVLEKPYTNKILSVLSTKKAYFYSNLDLIKILKISSSEFNVAKKYLLNISAIFEKNDKFRLNFPFFTARDVKKIKIIINKSQKSLLKVFYDNKNELYSQIVKIYPNTSPKISLYHLLCGKMFDGMFFEYLEKENFLKISYPQKDNRDYMLIGYQNDFVCNKFNQQLFCSFNNARFNQDSLSSFGTPSGERLDYFRYFKLRTTNKIHGNFKKLHKILKNYSENEIVELSLNKIKDLSCNKIVNNDNILKALKITKYVSKNNQVLVPIFDSYSTKLNEIYNFIISKFGSHIKATIKKVKEEVLSCGISCLNHEVSIDELCNELWHMFFGILNKNLIKSKIVATPKHFFHQGKYLKCVYFNNFLN